MTIVYVQNQLSHSALVFKTLKKMFIGKKLEVSHLKIFGCPIFVHILKEKRNKMESLGKKGIFMGYCEASKAFRIYIPGHHHIDISRDVMNMQRSRNQEDVSLKKYMKRNL
jgi:hypothetical protein